MKILLVEDNPGDARFTREVLEHIEAAGEIHTADRLDVALLLLRAELPDLVLLDLELPDSRGTATVAAMAGAAPDVPIVVLTSMDDEVLAADCIRAGACAYLVKAEVGSRALARALRCALANNAADPNRALREAAARLAASLEHTADTLERIADGPAGA